MLRRFIRRCNALTAIPVVLAAVLSTLAACGNSSTNPSDSLDTSQKRFTSTFAVKRWDGSNWVALRSSLSLTVGWRFTSLARSPNGTYQVAGGYSFKWTNNTGEQVTVRLNGVNLLDRSGLTVAEFDVAPSQEFGLGPDQGHESFGTFTFGLLDLNLLEFASSISPVGTATINP